MNVSTPSAIRGDERDLAWLVGLCEGEATFDLHKGRSPRIRVGMTDRDVVGRVATLLGTGIRLALHEAPAQPMWHAELQGARAEAIMRELLPHMGSRRSQRIATILAAAEFARAPERRTSIPGPRIERPAGIAKPDAA